MNEPCAGRDGSCARERESSHLGIDEWRVRFPPRDERTFSVEPSNAERCRPSRRVAQDRQNKVELCHGYDDKAFTIIKVRETVSSRLSQRLSSSHRCAFLSRVLSSVPDSTSINCGQYVCIFAVFINGRVFKALVRQLDVGTQVNKAVGEPDSGQLLRVRMLEPAQQSFETSLQIFVSHDR